MTGIYKIINNINGKMYIGQSINIEHRKYEHEHMEGDSYIHNAIKKYKWENFSFEIIEECSKEELDNKEIYWIEYYHTYTKDPLCNGYNETPGGDGWKGFSRKVKQFDLDGNYIKTFNSITEAEAELNMSSGKISKCCNYKSKTAGGYQWRYNEDLSNPVPQRIRGKSVDKYDLIGNYICTYGSIAVAAEDVCGNSSNISRACKKNISAFGYKWKYHDMID